MSFSISRVCHVLLLSGVCHVLLLSRVCPVLQLSRVCHVLLLSRVCHVLLLSRVCHVLLLVGLSRSTVVRVCLEVFMYCNGSICPGYRKKVCYFLFNVFPPKKYENSGYQGIRFLQNEKCPYLVITIG